MAAAKYLPELCTEGVFSKGKILRRLRRQFPVIGMRLRAILQAADRGFFCKKGVKQGGNTAASPPVLDFGVCRGRGLFIFYT